MSVAEAPVDHPERIDLRPLLPPNLMNILRDATPSRRFGYVYVPLGKCANTEIKRFLWQQHCRHGYEPQVPDDYFAVHNYDWTLGHQIQPNPWDGYSKLDHARMLCDLLDGGMAWRFCFVRNPFARLLSGYLDKVRNARLDADALAKLHMLPAAPADFAGFVEMVTGQPDGERNIHWASQVRLLAYEFLDYNFVGYVEDIEAGKRFIASRVFGSEAADQPSPPRHFTGAGSKLEEYYTPELARRVVDAFESDFELLGYTGDYRRTAPERDRASAGRCRAVAQRFRGQLEAGQSLLDILGRPTVTI